MASTTAPSGPKRGERFLHGVIWSWFSVIVSLFSGLLLAPYTIHKLGDEGYGVWTIIFSFADHFWLMDLGFRSATMKYTAHYRAIDRPDKVNEVLNTALLYATSVLTLTITATILFSKYIADFENVSPRYHHVFVMLIMFVGIGWASGCVFNLFSAGVEGYQRFDLSSRIWIISIAIRSFGIAAVLFLGHGLLAMGIIVLIALASTYVLTFLAFRKIFPEMRLSPSLATYSMFRQMLGYGIHTFVAGASLQLLNYSQPILIGHFLPSAFAGYYGMAVRLPQYSVDLVSKVGFVTGSHSAELAARNDVSALARMGIYINRYCFVLFAPVAIALIVYGTALFRLWIKPEFAAMSAPLLPPLVIGITLAVAAQYNSSSILYGLGKHQKFAISLFVEAVLCITGVYFVTPRYGLMGVAVVSSTLLVINRGLVTSWLLCRAVQFPLGSFLARIYLPPLAVAVPATLFAVWMKSHWLPGTSFVQLILACGLLAALYYAIAFFTCLKKEHRMLPIRWIRQRLGMQ